MEAVSLAVLAFTNKKEGFLYAFMGVVGRSAENKEELALSDEMTNRAKHCGEKPLSMSWKPETIWSNYYTCYRFMITLSLCLSHFVHLLYTLTIQKKEEAEASERRKFNATYSNF